MRAKRALGSAARGYVNAARGLALALLLLLPFAAVYAQSSPRLPVTVSGVNVNPTPPSGGNPLYTLAIQLPLINDSMLGASVNPRDPVMNVGGLYNFIMAISLVLIVIGAMVALLSEMAGKKGRNIVMEVVIGVIAVIIFPVIYNEVATLVNYITQTIIAYPNDYSTYGAAVQKVWDTATFGGSWMDIVFAGITKLAVWIMELIAWLMSYFLGTIRLFLIAAVLVGFPLAMALKMIPFAGKLSQMIEDTLFGLILASIMSAVVLGVANQVLSHYSGSLFDISGVQNDWIAIAAIFAVILMPTVFAPLTAIMFQTVSQTAMASGGAAVVIGASIAMPGAGGAIAGGKSAMSVFQGSMSQQTSAIASSPLPTMGIGPSRRLALKSAAGAFGGAFKRHAALPILQNAAIIGSTGLLSAAGAVQASKMLKGMTPSTVTTQDVLQSHEAARVSADLQGRIEHLVNLGKSGIDFNPGALVDPKTKEIFVPPSWNPRDPGHRDQYASPLRDSWTTGPAQSMSMELVSHNVVDAKVLNNPKAIEEVHHIVHSQISTLNPNSEDGARAIKNLKVYLDSEQFKATHGL